MSCFGFAVSVRVHRSHEQLEFGSVASSIVRLLVRIGGDGFAVGGGVGFGIC
jgi:hypothetical protein